MSEITSAVSGLDADIAQHERELEALLTRVMSAPLEPLLLRLDDQARRLTDLEGACHDIGERELPNVCSLIDEVRDELRASVRRMSAEVATLGALGPELGDLGVKLAALSCHQEERMAQLGREVSRITGLATEQHRKGTEQLAQCQLILVQSAQRLQRRVLWLSGFCAIGAIAAMASAVRLFV